MREVNNFFAHPLGGARRDFELKLHKNDLPIRKNEYEKNIMFSNKNRKKCLFNS